MSLLVAYESSDDENNKIEEIVVDHNNKISTTNSNKPESSKSAEFCFPKLSNQDDALIGGRTMTFKNIPAPVEKIDEENVEMIILPSKKEIEMREPPPPKRHRIVVSLPSIQMSDSEDDERNEPPKKKSIHGSSLLQFLPQPKFLPTKEASRPLIPHSLSKQMQNASQADKQQTTGAYCERNDDMSDDDDDESEGIHKNYLVPSANDDVSRHESSLYRYRDDDDDDPSMNVEQNIEPLPQPQAEMQSDFMIDHEFAKLRGKHKGSNFEIIDVKLDEHLSKYEVDRMKELTKEENMTSHSKKKGPNLPTSQQKRKHQITYLAHQAREKELELKNQWAENRFNKRQTQSKYGF